MEGDVAVPSLKKYSYLLKKWEGNNFVTGARKTYDRKHHAMLSVNAKSVIMYLQNVHTPQKKGGKGNVNIH